MSNIEENIMSEEAFNELIDNFEVVETLTDYGRKAIKQNVKKLKTRIQELEEENTTLRKANNITKKLKKEVKIEDITQVINKSYEEFIENFIPKQKVKDILQKNRNELFSTTYIDDKQYKPYTMQIDRINKIENELLEDK